MGKRNIVKSAAAFLLAVLLCAEGMPVYAVEEEIKGQLTAAKSLAELDLESNSVTINILIQQCIDLLPDGDPVKNTLQSVQTLLEGENANSAAISILLEGLIDESNQPIPTAGDGGEDNSVEVENNTEQAMYNSVVFPDSDAFSQTSFVNADMGLPVFEVTDFSQTHVPSSVLLDVPSDWGNNAAGGRSLVSYSPVNGSGAINPKAGTLTISHFPMESNDAESTFASYEKSISDMSVTADMQSEDISTANLPAKKLNFQMNVGANQFACETICFIYEETVYSIELMQGQQSAFNYFPVFGQVVQSAEIINSENPQLSDAAENVMDDSIKEEGPDGEDKESQTDWDEDLSSFLYEMNGHTYQFPTPVSQIDPSDIHLDRQMDLPYDICSDADMEFGSWTEIINTEYFYFENSFYKEMTGITNMTGYDTVLSEGILTALIDTGGTYLDVTLPGNIHVGSPEEDILKGFPAFEQQVMDGIASFIGNDYLYACNVRDDGCNGYVIIRNDDPFYSALSIICEDSLIKEISFECLGSERADGVFEASV